MLQMVNKINLMSGFVNSSSEMIKLLMKEAIMCKDGYEYDIVNIGPH